MKVRVYVYACVYVCVAWSPKCNVLCVHAYVCVYMCVNCRTRKESSPQLLPVSRQRKVKWDEKRILRTNIALESVFPRTMYVGTYVRTYVLTYVHVCMYVCVYKYCVGKSVSKNCV